MMQLQKPLSHTPSVMLQAAAPRTGQLQGEGQAFSCELEHKNNALHRGFLRLENTLLTNKSHIHSCTSSRKAVLPLSLQLGRQQQGFQLRTRIHFKKQE